MQVLAFAPSGARIIGDPYLEGGRTRFIPLAPGQKSVTVEDGVLRGERNLYSIIARAGQIIAVNVEAVEENAAFDVYEPGVRICCREFGIEPIGRALTGTSEADLQRWMARAPMTGPYLIAVGPTRGNATYKLRVSLC
jgi:hypothetical protein